jgi:hypothetical protein
MMIYIWTRGDAFGKKENLAKYELLFGWLKGRQVAFKPAGEDGTSVFLISNAAVWQIVVILL